LEIVTVSDEAAAGLAAVTTAPAAPREATVTRAEESLRIEFDPPRLGLGECWLRVKGM
jgi:hypothetical protein